MTAKILDGKVVADQIQAEIKEEILGRRYGRPFLSVILCTDDPASKIYVQKKIKSCESVGIDSRLILPHESTGWGPGRRYDYLDELLDSENNSFRCNGILLQLPLPADMQPNRHGIINKIAPEKDVDCFSSTNVGLLLQGNPRFMPCTPYGICRLLKYHEIQTDGKKVVVINRSDVVGKPLQAMLSRDWEYGNATVAMCHDHTPPEVLKETCLWADIIIVAVGKKKFLTADMVREGSVVIDVGINRDEGGKICGDADFVSVSEKASAITPVPGGVGPCTVAMLMHNTLAAFKVQNEIW